jgi:DNA-binding beta-propeller fold protein YncE
LLVAYSSSTATLNYIYAYDINESTSAITGATQAYYDTSVVYGPTAMAYDSTTGAVYVANGTTVMGNSIEKFAYDPTTKRLTRAVGVSFAVPTANTNCVNSMYIGP